MEQTKWFDRDFNFENGQNIFPSILERLTGTPIRLEEKIRQLPEDILRFSIDGTWTIKEHIGHLTDLEPLWQGRLDDIKSNQAELRPADLQNTKTNQAGHNARPIAELLSEFREIRDLTIRTLQAIDEATVYRSALHPRLKTPMRTMDLFLFAAEHDDHHLARITKLIETAKMKSTVHGTGASEPVDQSAKNAPKPLSKKIGLVGGISWVSTMDYYRLINQGINKRLGGLSAAECVIYSLNFADVQEMGWTNSYGLLHNACESLKKTGVDCIVLCANTAHLFAGRLQEEIQLPVIHIVEETARVLQRQGIKKAGLLGTRFTMEMDFYSNTLHASGIETIIPENQQTRDYIQQTIKEELGVGFINPDTKLRYIDIAQELIRNGAECIILGCTEIPGLISQNDFPFPVIDTAKVHADAIVEYATNSGIS